eukprot:PLAT14870.2.p1 GENE.PLAT14870.2~~PLAT14870.2.p1  ORF type:complete len:321 (+),score=189.22 PLAT14870.2:70-963(+)
MELGDEAAPTDDLLSMDLSGTPAPAAAPAAAAAPAPVGPGGEIGLDPAFLPSMREWFKAVVVAPRGLLYEDASLQVAVQHAYRESECRMELRVVNKHATDMTGFALRVGATTQLKIALAPGTPDSIPAGGAVTQAVRVLCMAPFKDPPALQLAFVRDGSRYAYPFRLPVTAIGFMKPLAMAAADWSKRWAATNPDGEQQRVMSAAEAIDLATMPAKLAALRVGVLPGVDASAAVFNGASVLHTATVGPRGDKLTVGVLTKLECNPDSGHYRLSIRATVTSVGEAVMNVIRQQLAKLE